MGSEYFGDLYSLSCNLNVDHFISLLHKFEYHSSEIWFLKSGFHQGFRIGFSGPRDRALETDNQPSVKDDPELAWDKIMTEVQAHRVAGPFHLSNTTSSHPWVW